MCIALQRENEDLKKMLLQPPGNMPNYPDVETESEYPNSGTSSEEEIANAPMLRNHRNLRRMNQIEKSNFTRVCI